MHGLFTPHAPMILVMNTYDDSNHTKSPIHHTHTKTIPTKTNYLSMCNGNLGDLLPSEPTLT